jgi:hypothetical protein
MDEIWDPSLGAGSMKRAKGEDDWHLDPRLVAEDREARQRYKQQGQDTLDPRWIEEEIEVRRRRREAIDLTEDND